MYVYKNVYKNRKRKEIIAFNKKIYKKKKPASHFRHSNEFYNIYLVFKDC